ncbi:bifunctional 2-C-methyl-D-erythritol 4-phosphate cytidylyltransferase/2-C-methyl-D-erythritol 2,4-cyclodiphosphate synthase [soil metagenome]
MSVCAILVAAGQGERFGGDKTLALLSRRPVWRWSYDTLSKHPGIDEIVLVHGEGNRDSMASVPSLALVPGGCSRQESVLLGCRACPEAEWVLVHDAARPFLPPGLIDALLDTRGHAEAAAPALPATDTIRLSEDGQFRLVDRDTVMGMQTPQLARRAKLVEALQNAKETFTDELAALESVGCPVTLVPGSVRNFKLTSAEDFSRARLMVGPPEVRTGIGYDIHPFSVNPHRVLHLGGIAFPGHKALEGHSDADVLLHAITDAILGATAMGDIGEHFPNTDPRWAGAPSSGFLRAAKEIVEREGWRITSIDSTVIAETPKVMKRSGEMREAIAGACDIEPERVSVKATTNEGLGSIGRSEGIAAFATATLAERF